MFSRRRCLLERVRARTIPPLFRVVRSGAYAGCSCPCINGLPCCSFGSQQVCSKSCLRATQRLVKHWRFTHSGITSFGMRQAETEIRPSSPCGRPNIPFQRWFMSQRLMLSLMIARARRVIVVDAQAKHIESGPAFDISIVQTGTAPVKRSEAGFQSGRSAGDLGAWRGIALHRGNPPTLGGWNRWSLGRNTIQSAGSLPSVR